MARPIKETPILYGEDARRFEARMKERRRISPEERAEMKATYEALKSVCDFMWYITVDAYAAAIPFYLRNGFVPLNEEDVDEPTRLLYFDLNDLDED